MFSFFFYVSIVIARKALLFILKISAVDVHQLEFWPIFILCFLESF